MLKKLLLFALLISCLLLQNCSSAASENLQSKVETEPTPQPSATLPEQENKIQLPSTGKANFKGVSFSYNPQIFVVVKAEEIAERVLEDKTDEPGYVTPQHRYFTFDSSTEYNDMYLSVFPVKDFPKVYAVGGIEYVKRIERGISEFKKVLKDKNFRVENQIPFIPYMNAHQAFQVKVKHFNFPNGKGILFLTFWSMEIELPSNKRLRYVFEGITNDGKYYILAEMPVRVDFLSSGSSLEYEDYKVNWGKLNDKDEMNRFAAVNQKIADRLENLPQNEFEPNLDELEKIISTLNVEK